MKPTFGDLDGVTVEHLLGVGTGVPRPLVRLRAVSERVILLGEFDPAQARSLAADLSAAAARAEYELDLVDGLLAVGAVDSVEACGPFLLCVRDGERRREEGGA